CRDGAWSGRRDHVRRAAVHELTVPPIPRDRGSRSRRATIEPMPRWVLFLAPWVVLGLCLLPRLARPNWGARADDAFSPPSSLRIERDLTYARYGKREMHLDLYRPAQV